MKETNLIFISEYRAPDDIDIAFEVARSSNVMGKSTCNTEKLFFVKPSDDLVQKAKYKVLEAVRQH